MAGSWSVIPQVDRYAHVLGASDSYVHQIGVFVAGNMSVLGSVFQDVASLQSNLSPSLHDKISSFDGNLLMSRGFVLRRSFSGPHLLLSAGSTGYPALNTVGFDALPGQVVDRGGLLPRFSVQGRVSGREYKASFVMPISLGAKGVLFRGRIHETTAGIFADVRDRRTGGITTTNPRPTGTVKQPIWVRLSNVIRTFFNPQFDPAAAFEPILKQPRGLYGGVPSGITEAIGGRISSNGIMAAHLPLEQKLVFLGAHLAAHLENEIDAAMKEMNEAPEKPGSRGGFATPSLLGGYCRPGGGWGMAPHTAVDSDRLAVAFHEIIGRRQEMFRGMTSLLHSLYVARMAALQNIRT